PSPHMAVPPPHAAAFVHWQCPPLQMKPPRQALAQPPQCAASPTVLVSQPFAALPSQSPKPSGHPTLPPDAVDDELVEVEGELVEVEVELVEVEVELVEVEVELDVVVVVAAPPLLAVELDPTVPPPRPVALELWADAPPPVVAPGPPIVPAAPEPP